MCNDYGNKLAFTQYKEAFSEIRIPFRFKGPIPNLEPRDEIWPSETAPVILPSDTDGAAFTQLRWGLISKTGGKPVINMRAEGKSFAAHRCLIPASHYFEFTGTKSPKTRWRFTRNAEDWFCFAGIMGKAVLKEEEVHAFSLLTIAPGPDTAEYHDREPVIVDRQNWAAWLRGEPATELLQSSRRHSLAVIESPREKTTKTGELL